MKSVSRPFKVERARLRLYGNARPTTPNFLTLAFINPTRPDDISLDFEDD